MGSSNSGVCELLMHTFEHACIELGVPIAHEKTSGPTTVLTFLGFIIDMMAIIPPEKLEKLRNLLQPLMQWKKVTLKELESAVGLISFRSRAIPSSRAFLRRFYDLMLYAKRPYHRIRLNGEVKADIQLLLEFIEKFNCQLFFPHRVWTSDEIIKLFTDSSGTPDLGCGAYFAGKWAQLRWPHSWKTSNLIKNMTFLELVPVVLSIFLWVHLLGNKKVLFHIDNMALVSIVNKRSSKDKNIMKLIRSFVLLSMIHNVQFKAVYIQSAKNKISDSLSRFQDNRFRFLAPETDKSPGQIPSEFLNLISMIQ